MFNLLAFVCHIHTFLSRYNRSVLYLQMLQERFLAFSHDTIQTGTERVADANKLSDDLINIGHSDADQIAQWKDLINEAWEDLLELISTREEVKNMF